MLHKMYVVSAEHYHRDKRRRLSSLRERKKKRRHRLKHHPYEAWVPSTSGEIVNETPKQGFIPGIKDDDDDNDDDSV